MKKEREKLLKKTVISIDPGLAKIGYSIFKNGKYLTHGVISTPSKNKLNKRISYLKNVIHDICLKYECEIMICEEFFSHKRNKNGIHTSKVIGSFLGVSGDLDMDFLTYSPKTLKTEIGGKEANKRKQKGETESAKQKRQKQAVLEGVISHLGFNPELSYSNNHAVDSIGLFFLLKKFKKPIDTSLDINIFE